MNNRNKIDALRKSFLNFYNENNFHSAIEDLENLVKLYNKDFDIYEYSIDLYNLGFLYQKLGKISSATKVYKKVIRLLEKKDYNIEKDLKILEVIIDCENAIGICYSQNKSIKLDFALNSFEKALSLTRKYFSNDEAKLLNIIHNIGCAYYDIQRYEDAIYYHLEELSLRKEKDIDFIDNLNYLGYDYEATENYEKAVGYFKQALQLIKGFEGINSDEYMNNTYHLATVYFKMQDYENSIKCYEKVCSFIENKNKQNIPYFSETLTKLAEAYIKFNKPKEALNIQLKALKFIQSTVGQNHIYYASNVKKVADIYYLEKDYFKSLFYYEKEAMVKKDIIGMKNEEYINSVLNIINVKLKAGLGNDEELQNQICNLIDFGFSYNSYKRALLTLSKIYIENNMAENLCKIYEFYKDVDANTTFDDMIKSAKEIEEDIIDKKNKLFKNEHIFEENFESIEEHIFDGIKNLFDGIKKEIDKYESNLNDDENSENNNDNLN